MSPSLLAVVGLAAVLAAALARLGRLGRAFEAERRRAGSLEREASELRRAQVQLQHDRHLVSEFLREFPHFTRELHSGVKERHVPTVLLNVVLRSLQPQQALVLVRRRRAESDPERANRLVVAAAGPQDCVVSLGTEIAIGRGELGYVAETQRVMSRADFESETALTRMRLRQDGLPGFEADLVAPMVFGDEVLGLIAISRPRRVSEDAKAILRLIAQTGAQALHNAAAYVRMKLTADLDGLTKVFNKRHMTQTLAERVFEAQQRMEPLSILLFDVDHFKNYNDVNGHVAGDALLRELARLVQENIRKDDVFGRFGGEEFLLILSKTPLPQALAAADKIRAAIQAHPFPFADHQPLGFVSVSGGVAECPSDALDSAGLLRAADQALYDAKHQGRNRVLATVRRYLSDGEPQTGDPELEGSLPAEMASSW